MLTATKIRFCEIKKDEWSIRVFKHKILYEGKKTNHTRFMPLRSKIGGHIVFVLSVILHVCHSAFLSFSLPLWSFYLANNIWTVTARALIFHMSFPCDETFPSVTLFFTLWAWPWSYTHFLKTLTLLILFEQRVLEFLCFTWVFLVTRPVSRYHYFLPCDRDLEV